MSDVIAGHEQNPAALLEQVFGQVAADEMRGLPFYRDHIPLRACGFQLFEQQWIGALLTPWMLSLVVLPGPQQSWQRRAVGERLVLALPCGAMGFTVSEIAGCGQYLSRSLMSPLDTALSAERALLLTEQSARMALSLPVVNADAPANPRRRALFNKVSQIKNQHA
ncbi:[NiFe] hydrogenase assembly chaperone, HybE family domain protein [Yersinia rochesterensis]|uniref:[NiFe] hydrogenase assembly chaperone, HybE family domain protein n=1 Tax=Yersinia rochesterensis TaxID=1604335 RepID=A0ABN4FA08_9GAMM|nr:hydrogenase-2 assembly chaperone [Yersinia rochesterensis]AIN19868.1 hydrogenase-2 operon protein hybE [Yersinia rochesterensis]AJI88756.1 hydrogenase-2 operon protein hybE [Yersinia frederiksenii Y225]AJJ34230.1 [NiFe] hydrogenase assembly chaperone, HybE family domain protein [Yersinia rochesterensis]CRY64882.1 hydrogenase 2-specific chaperone [Yersinia kristensenii]